MGGLRALLFMLCSNVMLPICHSSSNASGVDQPTDSWFNEIDFTHLRKNMQYTEIEKKKAMRLHKEGKVVYMAASNLNPSGPMGAAELPSDIKGKSDWHVMEKHFKWYNCIAECGTGIKYYTKRAA